MTLLELFMKFLNKILNIKLFDISLIKYLIAIAIIIIIFKIIGAFSGAKINRKNKDNKKGSE